MNRCVICGGSAGRLSHGESHNLCVELKKLGLPTPSLGEACSTCGGRGHVATKDLGCAIFLDAGPAAIRRAIEAVFPACKTCGGTGTVQP